MGQEFSTIVQIIVKADRGKAIALRRFQILSLHFVPILQSAVYILYPVCCLHFVLTGIRGTNTVYFWLQLFAQHTQSTTKYLCVS